MFFAVKKYSHSNELDPDLWFGEYSGILPGNEEVENSFNP